VSLSAAAVPLTCSLFSRQVAWEEITIGQLWQANIKSKKKEINAILEQAQGESALEEFLAEVRKSVLTDLSVVLRVSSTAF